jgi:hypothetical protein
MRFYDISYDGRTYTDIEANTPKEAINLFCARDTQATYKIEETKSQYNSNCKVMLVSGYRNSTKYYRLTRFEKDAEPLTIRVYIYDEFLDGQPNEHTYYYNLIYKNIPLDDIKNWFDLCFYNRCPENYDEKVRPHYTKVLNDLGAKYNRNIVLHTINAVKNKSRYMNKSILMWIDNLIEQLDILNLDTRVIKLKGMTEKDTNIAKVDIDITYNAVKQQVIIK